MASSTPPPIPPRLAASRQTPLVGRHHELEVLEDAWSQVLSGNRQVIFVGGEPGAGKTRLAAEVAGVLHDNDVTVLVGTSSDEVGIPYQPFAEMLDHLFATIQPGFLPTLDPGTLAELGRLSPNLDRHHAGDASGFSELVGDVRRDLFDAVASLFRRLAIDHPLALILDDIHWAQAATLELLKHIIQVCTDARVLILGTFRTTAPDRSEDLSARLAELHRLEGVRRLDLGGLDTEAIAEYVSLRSGLPVGSAREAATVLRDRTGGNPFFLRELWTDLEAHGGVAALRSPNRVPASIADTLETRLAGLGDRIRETVEMAAVLGDHFDLSTLNAATDVDPAITLQAVDAATAVGLIEPVEDLESSYSFVHSLTRQAVVDRLPPSRRALLHARAAETLERQREDSSVIPRLAHHYLSARVLGYQEKAAAYTRQAAEIAAKSLAYEEAALWFERSASLHETDLGTRAEILFAAASNHLRAGDFSRARSIFERLTALPDVEVRLAAAIGYEDANWRPGLADSRAADLLTSAIAASELDSHDSRYIRALGSLGRALAFAGETPRAREVGNRAIELARRKGDRTAIAHALKTSLWHGLTPDVAELQLERATELAHMAKETGDHETLGSAAYFRAMVSYLLGRPEDLEEATFDIRRAAQANGQPFFSYVAGCVTQGRAFMRGDFEGAEHWAKATLRLGDSFGVDTTEGPFGVQMYMIQRERGGLDRFRSLINGRETFNGRWIPGLLALYTELGIEEGIGRTLRHVMNRDLAAHTTEAQWPIELVFMVEGALALKDEDAAARLQPFLTAYAGKNLVGGQFVAVFGSADRYLGRVAELLGDLEQAEHHLSVARDMDKRMGATIHEAETLAHHSNLALAMGDLALASRLAREARTLAEPVGQLRVSRILDSMTGGDDATSLTEREVEVLRLLAAGLSNREIGDRLFISANTAANHVRSILIKTGAANRTQAAMYAAEHHLV